MKNYNMSWTETDGTRVFQLDGKFHRLDGPAVIHPNGTMSYLQYNLLHREDGPAIIYHDGSKEYYNWGERHRSNGPAVVFPLDGVAEIWTHGEIPSIWNDHIITEDNLTNRYPSAKALVGYNYDKSNHRVYWVGDPNERTLAILEYS